MKRPSKQGSRAMRHARNASKGHGPSNNDEINSKYGKKRRSGNMMYGPGCCAHNVKLGYNTGGR